jgi:hypothetical protein
MGMLCNLTFAMLEDGKIPTTHDTLSHVTDEIFDIRKLTPEELKVSPEDLDSFKENGFVLNLMEENLNQSHLQVFSAVMWYVNNKYGSPFLVIGESLKAGHAKDRFANPRWFFLDPFVYDENDLSYASKYGRVIFQGQISGLRQLVPSFMDKTLPLFGYILDDINAITNRSQFSDYVPDNFRTNDMLLQTLFFLLAKGGILTTSAGALMPYLEEDRGLNDEDFSLIQKVYSLQTLRDNWKECLSSDEANAYLAACYKYGRGEEFIQEAENSEYLDDWDDWEKQHNACFKHATLMRQKAIEAFRTARQKNIEENRSEPVTCQNDRDLMIAVKDHHNVIFDAKWFSSHQKPGPSLPFCVIRYGETSFQFPLLLDWIPLPLKALRSCEQEVKGLRDVIIVLQKKISQLNEQLRELDECSLEPSLLLMIKNGEGNNWLKIELKAQGVSSEAAQEQKLQELRRKAEETPKEKLELQVRVNETAEEELQEKISNLNKEIEMLRYKSDDHVRPLSINGPLFLVKK